MIYKKGYILVPLFITVLLSFFEVLPVVAQKSKQGKMAAKPLFRDPVYDGAADPVIIWNKAEKRWFMFYTNRRAKDTTLDGVKWVHGTRIGIAESTDGGATWKYRDTCDIQYRFTDYTHWAPDVIEHKGLYHMFLTYVPGVFSDWRHPRQILHLTSTNLINWKYASTLQLSSERCIDACVFQMPDGNWRMYYNNEADKKSIYYADSPDLYTWKDSGKKVVSDKGGEGPKVFSWKGKYWMVVDNWQGLGVYSSDNLVDWKRQEKNILQLPGRGEDDMVIGGHADVMVNGDRAFVVYFTHPGRTPENKGKNGYEQRRSSLQIAELEHIDGQIVCDRDKPVYIKLTPPKMKRNKQK
jgi:sucrose-6-phosphate hydrolase SacC (GH32 family)